MLLVPAKGQFPSDCGVYANRGSNACCPKGCSGKRRCEDISAQASWSTIGESGGSAKSIIENISRTTEVYNRRDTRFEWPTRVFRYVCKCYEGYGGAACDECDFGYFMNSSVCHKVSRTRIRKNFLHMSKKEKADLIEVLLRAKQGYWTDNAWAAIVEEPNQHGRGLQLENISTYDLFVYQHFFSKREGDVKGDNGSDVCKTTDLDLSKVDFAHEGPGFLTWHRYYLLLVERELGRIAEALRYKGIFWNRYNFTLPYWDWDDSEAALADIFSEDHFGTFTKGANRDFVSTGKLFGNNEWPTVCDRHYQFNVNTSISVTCAQIRTVCDPNSDRMKIYGDIETKGDNHPILQRGIFTLRGRNESDIRALPDRNTIKYLFDKETQYDAPCYPENINKDGYDSTASEYSFRNRVEGFVNLQNPATGQFKDCKTRTSRDHNNFHNAVHIYIHGHMRIVPSASNDPIFFLHHANIDRIFEQ